MVEADIKGMEKNVTKIRTILYSMDNEDITLTEHLYHCEVKHQRCSDCPTDIRLMSPIQHFDPVFFIYIINNHSYIFYKFQAAAIFYSIC